MNLDTSRWDALLVSALTTPGLGLDPFSRDLSTFIWGRWNTPDWSAEQAFTRLGITRLDFDERFANTLGGYALSEGLIIDGQVAAVTVKGIALNPRATMKIEVAAHELAHVVLRHPHSGAGDQTRQPIEEFEAECVALLVCHALTMPEHVLSHCRVYVQYFAAMPCAGPLPQTWAHITRAARTIVAAGAGRFTVVPEPPPLKVQSLDEFSRRLVMGGRAR